MSQLISLRTLRETPTDRILKGNSLLDAVAVLVGDPELACGCCTSFQMHVRWPARPQASSRVCTV